MSVLLKSLQIFYFCCFLFFISALLTDCYSQNLLLKKKKGSFTEEIIFSCCERYSISYNILDSLSFDLAEKYTKSSVSNKISYALTDLITLQGEVEYEKIAFVSDQKIDYSALVSETKAEGSVDRMKFNFHATKMFMYRDDRLGFKIIGLLNSPIFDGTSFINQTGSYGAGVGFGFVDKERESYFDTTFTSLNYHAFGKKEFDAQFKIGHEATASPIVFEAGYVARFNKLHYYTDETLKGFRHLLEHGGLNSIVVARVKAQLDALHMDYYFYDEHEVYLKLGYKVRKDVRVYAQLSGRVYNDNELNKKILKIGVEKYF